jgi:hypothetical protein
MMPAEVTNAWREEATLLAILRRAAAVRSTQQVDLDVRVFHVDDRDRGRSMVWG